MDAGILLLTLLETIAIWALYWTAWKIRGDLLEGREKLKAELSEMRKSLDGKTGGA